MFTRHGLRTGVIIWGCAALLTALGGCTRTSPPTVSSVDPVRDAAGVPVNTKLSATFSEPMDPATLNAATFTLKQGVTLVPGTVATTGVTAIFTPENALLPNTLYTARITTGAEGLGESGRKCKLCPADGALLGIGIAAAVGAVLLAAGAAAAANPVDNHLAEDYVWTFTTGALADTAAPTVVSTDPADGAAGVALDRGVSATFSESMDPFTLTAATFLVVQGDTPVPGALGYSGVTAIFTPDSAFAPATLYTVIITTGAEDLSGNGLAADYVWAFSTGVMPDTTAPTVTATVPLDAAAGVALDANLSATFSEAMNPLTVSTVTFTLTRGVVPVPGTVTYAGVTAVFNPSSDLAPSALYTARVLVGVEDLSGNTLAGDYVWTFTTGSLADITAPTVSSTDPADGDVDVSTNKKISATFSEAMDPLTITTATFLLEEETTVPAKAATPVTGTVTYSGVTAVFAPTGGLAANALYTATITAGVTDLAGNAKAEAYVWTFATGSLVDDEAPMVSYTIPPNGATDVPLHRNMAALFSETMDPLTINSATFTLHQGTTQIPGGVSYSGIIGVLDPSVDLLPNTLYTARITTGARDLAGNALEEDYSWSFTTGETPDDAAPTVSATYPPQGAVGAGVNINLSATFSEEMDPLTVTTATFTLQQGTTPVAGTVSYAGVTAVFNPTLALAPSTVYTAVVWMEAADLAGNTLAADYTWTFTTGVTPDGTAPTVSFTAPDQGDTGVPVGSNLSATFDEAMNPLTINTVNFTLQQGTTQIPGTVTYAGVTAMFNPSAPLAPNTLYTATIKKGSADLAGNTLAEDYMWTFTTGTAPDTTRPFVSSTAPEQDAVGVPVGANAAATFSEAMDPLTINTTTFALYQGAVLVPGSVTYAGVTAMFNPAAALASGTAYTAVVLASAADLSGNTLAGDYAWTFTTGTAPDTVRPLVVSTAPMDGSAGAPLGSNIAAVFSEAMDPLTINAATFLLRQGTTAIPGTVIYSGLTARINPAANLAPNTLYTATIRASAADLSGNTLAADYIWTFTTGVAPDTTRPMVTFTAPINGAAGVPLGSNLSVTFSEMMDPLTISAAAFSLYQGPTRLPGSLTYAGVTAMFNPAAPMAPNTLYTATMMASAADLSGNTLAADYAWTFTTGVAPDTIRPTVSSTVPVNGAAGVPLGSNLAATFSEAMDPLTITTAVFTLNAGTTVVPGVVTYTGVTALFNPAIPLAPNTVHTARIRTGAADLSGNTLAADYLWTFTTGAAPDTTRPMVSFTAPVNEATGVPLGSNLAATFSEAMDPLTITTAVFTLSAGTAAIPGTVTYAGVTVLFNPATPLAANTVYTARILASAADLSGNTLADDYEWTFTTGVAPDTVRPMVSSTAPAHRAVGVPLGSNLAATFSEPMDPLTITTAVFTVNTGTTVVSGVVTYAGVTALFNPAAPLAANTFYTARIMADAADLSGNTLAGDYEWTFTTGVAPDTIRPMVSFTAPVNGAVAVPLGSNLAVTFSEPMDPLTITTAVFTLNEGMNAVSGVVTYAGVTALFNPAAPLAPNTLYTATMMADAADLSGNTLAGDYVWTFTTGEVPDSSAPMVSFTDPMDMATDVPVNKRISATFSEVMDPLTITTLTFTLDDGVNSVAGAVTYAGVTATFTPSDDLAPDTTYTALVWMEASDLAGNQMAGDYEWTFTTGAEADLLVPEVISTDPEDLAVDVPVNTMVSATFSEVMDPLTITTLTFTLDDGVNPVLGVVTSVGVTATFVPALDLEPDTTYTALVWMEASDLAGNPLAGDYEWTFTTGAALDDLAPEVTSTDPVIGAEGVPINKKVTATFSEAMDPLTVTSATFTLAQGTSLVPGTVLYADEEATFTPDGGLAPNTTYTASVAMEAADLAGNPMVSDFVWTFTTGVSTGQDTIDLGSAGAFAVLAGSTVANTGPTIVTGDLGVSPGTAVDGFPPGILNGSMFTGVASAAGQAKLDLTAAFNDAASRSVGPVSLPGNLSGLTLYPGLYTNSTSVMLSVGNVTLDAQGDENAVFIFQMGSTLTTGSSTQVVLSGNAQAANIFWQVGTSATLGTTSIFKGNILAGASVTLATGANLEGRALTQDGAVTLDSAVVTAPAP